jgi:hypothetical protein
MPTPFVELEQRATAACQSMLADASAVWTPAGGVATDAIDVITASVGGTDESGILFTAYSLSVGTDQWVGIREGDAVAFRGFDHVVRAVSAPDGSQKFVDIARV